jgi:hypothetical protein
MNDPSPWLGLAKLTLQFFQGVFSWLPKKGPKLIFIQQPMSGWRYLDDVGGGVIEIVLLLHGTNDSNTDGVIVSLVQIRRRSKSPFRKREPWQDCTRVDIGGEEPLMPMWVVPPIAPRSTVVFRIMHHQKSERPKQKKPIRLVLKVTDQRGRLHLARLTVPARDNSR